MNTRADTSVQLSASAIAKAIFDIESALDLNADTWRQGDVHWWPLYRLEIYRLLFAAQAGATAATPGPRGYRRLLKLLGPAWRLMPRADTTTPPGAVWLVSDGLSWSRLGSVEVERFCTPIQQWCKGLGLRSVLIDRASPAPRRGEKTSGWWAPALHRRKIAATLLARLRPNPQHAERVRHISLAAERVGVALPALSARRFDAMARAIDLTATWLQARLQAARVQAVFLVSFYDVTGYAFTLAAARAGVRCVDVQHGVTGPFHLAYAPWPVLRQLESGWRLLPSHFWSWTVADTALINGWGKQVHPARSAVCGGHPFMQAWASGLMKLPPEMQTRLDQLLLAAGGRPRVLVTLQPGLTHADALAPLIQAWKLRPEVSWWLRLHPMALAEGPAIQALARHHGVASFDIETATALPLPALLVQAHVHATHSSSTVIEAQTVGLCSVVWSAYGAELVPEQVALGNATLAMDGAALVAALTQASRPSPPTEKASADSNEVDVKPVPGMDNQPIAGEQAVRCLLGINP